MQTINISDFRANLLKYLEMANTGEQILVTSHGKLLATICPPANRKKQARQQLKLLSSTAKVHDVVAPIDSDWDVLS